LIVIQLVEPNCNLAVILTRQGQDLRKQT